MSDSVRPIDSSPRGSPIPGILQARALEWVAISFSNASKWKVKKKEKKRKWKVKMKSLSHVWLLATPWTAAHQAPLSVGFSRQEHWSGGPLPSPSHPPIPHQWCANHQVWCAKSVQLCLTLAAPWTVTCQTSLSMGFSRQEYWSELPFSPPGDLPDSEVKP